MAFVFLPLLLLRLILGASGAFAALIGARASTPTGQAGCGTPTVRAIDANLYYWTGPFTDQLSYYDYRRGGIPHQTPSTQTHRPLVSAAASLTFSIPSVPLSTPAYTEYYSLAAATSEVTTVLTLPLQTNKTTAYTTALATLASSGPADIGYVTEALTIFSTPSPGPVTVPAGRAYPGLELTASSAVVLMKTFEIIVAASGCRETTTSTVTLTDYVSAQDQAHSTAWAAWGGSSDLDGAIPSVASLEIAHALSLSQLVLGGYAGLPTVAFALGTETYSYHEVPQTFLLPESSLLIPPLAGPAAAQLTAFPTASVETASEHATQTALVISTTADSSPITPMSRSTSRALTPPTQPSQTTPKGVPTLVAGTIGTAEVSTLLLHSSHAVHSIAPTVPNPVSASGAASVSGPDAASSLGTVPDSDAASIPVSPLAPAATPNSATAPILTTLSAGQQPTAAGGNPAGVIASIFGITKTSRSPPSTISTHEAETSRTRIEQPSGSLSDAVETASESHSSATGARQAGPSAIVISVGSVVVTAQAFGSALLIGSQTLTPGSAIAVGGQTVSLDPSHTALVVGSTRTILLTSIPQATAASGLVAPSSTQDSNTPAPSLPSGLPFSSDAWRCGAGLWWRILSLTGILLFFRIWT